MYKEKILPKLQEATFSSLKAEDESNRQQQVPPFPQDITKALDMDREFWVCIIALTGAGHCYGFCITGHTSVVRFPFFSWGILTKASVAALSLASVMRCQKKDNPGEAEKSTVWLKKL